ncbi:hypothetical protein D9619_010110 [Psilocybe cf. subviscida]|uniref:Uncharacterized protein n=1 Tax=Psilocybe cf. subviscida TaxID=2480587 RepID=A0A8H5BKB2_9AGAR|nr:hypothetical protein D9619_010110 [Psilocybe cf. subviscida]
MGRIEYNESMFLLAPHQITAHPKYFLGVFPPFMRPYMELIRLEKPTGTVLMFWPFAWGLTMAAFRIGLPCKEYILGLIKFFIAAFILRSSACTVNDIVDREMDAGVSRTQSRPLASGRVSVRSALIFLLVQYSVGISFFHLVTEGIALWAALFQLLPMFIIYPFLKRYTHWPQAWLGFAMNFGVITAWSATTGSIPILLTFTLLAACWCWTMLYDTIYACQDIKDDVKMGVRSTAILFGSWIRPLLILVGVFFLALLAVSGHLNGQSWIFYIVSVGELLEKFHSKRSLGMDTMDWTGP